MSEVSRSAPTAPKPATAPANRSPTGKALEERGDVFSALLSLVAETRAAPAGEATAGDAGAPSDETEADTPEPAKDGSDNPVAQLLGWVDPRSMADGTTPTGTADRAAATDAAGTTIAAAGLKTDGASIDITGMQPLATPEAIDPAVVPPAANTSANTAAGRAVGAAVPALGDARVARTNSARRDAKTSAAADSIANTTAGLRAPTTLWQPMTNASTRAAAPAGGSEALRARGVAWGNSTVSMDLSTAREADGVAGNAVSLTARLSAMLAGQTQTDGAAPAPLLGATTEAGASPAEGSPPADLLPHGEAAPEPEPTQISHWSTQHLRHAHLRLGDSALDSVDIRLSMQGQELSVDFRTDNADIRQSLAQQANQSLAVLLERSGIALADVSVGAQQQQRQSAGQNSEPQRDRTDQVGSSRAAARVEADASMSMHALAAQALRADGSRPLDLFV